MYLENYLAYCPRYTESSTRISKLHAKVRASESTRDQYIIGEDLFQGMEVHLQSLGWVLQDIVYNCKIAESTVLFSHQSLS